MFKGGSGGIGGSGGSGSEDSLNIDSFKGGVGGQGGIGASRKHIKEQTQENSRTAQQNIKTEVTSEVNLSNDKTNKFSNLGKEKIAETGNQVSIRERLSKYDVKEKLMETFKTRRNQMIRQILAGVKCPCLNPMTFPLKYSKCCCKGMVSFSVKDLQDCE